MDSFEFIENNGRRFFSTPAAGYVAAPDETGNAIEVTLSEATYRKVCKEAAREGCEPHEFLSCKIEDDYDA
jgi:hypothetical protein